MTESGKMTNLTAKEYTLIPMEQSMKANGKMTYSMEKVMKPGLMGRVTKDSMFEAKNMEMQHFNGEMEVHLLANLLRTSFRVKASIVGRTEESMMVIG